MKIGTFRLVFTSHLFLTLGLSWVCGNNFKTTRWIIMSWLLWSPWTNLVLLCIITIDIRKLELFLIASPQLGHEIHRTRLVYVRAPYPKASRTGPQCYVPQNPNRIRSLLTQLSIWDLYHFLDWCYYENLFGCYLLRMVLLITEYIWYSKKCESTCIFNKHKMIVKKIKAVR